MALSGPRPVAERFAFKNGKWKKFKTAPPEMAAQPPLAVKWRGQTATPSFDGLTIGEGKAKRSVPMPQSSGTHISALLPRGAVLWAALFGDGIWAWDGSRWSRPNLRLPEGAREITALAQSSNGKTAWLGTRRRGVWQLSNGTWTNYLRPNEPFAHNIQTLCSFRGALWASTLEDGLIVRDARGWQHLAKGTLSSNAPRQMAVFAGKLYVRHSNEVVDQFDGTTWKRNVFPLLPRKQIISLAADSNRLYLGQWGGWSEWDGKTFSHHLRIPQLQIVPLQHIVPDGNTLWLGTENRGLFRWKRANQKLELFDERHGLARPLDFFPPTQRAHHVGWHFRFGPRPAHRWRQRVASRAGTQAHWHYRNRERRRGPKLDCDSFWPLPSQRAGRSASAPGRTGEQ